MESLTKQHSKHRICFRNTYRMGMHYGHARMCTKALGNLPKNHLVLGPSQHLLKIALKSVHVSSYFCYQATRQSAAVT